MEGVVKFLTATVPPFKFSSTAHHLRNNPKKFLKRVTDYSTISYFSVELNFVTPYVIKSLCSLKDFQNNRFFGEHMIKSTAWAATYYQSVALEMVLIMSGLSTVISLTVNFLQ